MGTTSPVMVRAGLAQLNPAPSQSEGNTITFYIAPDGSDRWSGQLDSPNPTKTDGPFATLKKARDVIRRLKQQQGGKLTSPVAVFLRSGTYYLTEPVVFEAEDSGTAECPVTFAAFAGEKVTLSGGRLITGWRQIDKNLWATQLPDVKAGNWYFRLLRTGNEWAIRARYPKFDPQQPHTGGWLHAQWWGKPWEKGTFNRSVSLKSAGDKLEWRIVVPAAGEYKVWVSYIHNIEAHSSELAAMRVGNGEPTLLKSLPTTGDKYRWVQAATIRLAAGEQTLVWENFYNGKFDLDAFCLTDDSDWHPETAIRMVKPWGIYELEPPQPGAQLLIVQAEACASAHGSQITLPDGDLPGLFDRILVAPAVFPQWKNWDGAEVHIFPAWGWLNTILKVKSVDPDKQTLFVNSEQDIRSGNRFFITNVREALDSPNEWYLDGKTGELIYWAVQPNFPNQEVVAPALKQLIVLQGNSQTGRFVKHIHFRGLTFTDTDYTVFESSSDSKNLPDDSAQSSHPNIFSNGYYTPADAAFLLVAAQQCLIENCTFVNLGGYAVRLEQHSSQNEIIGNNMLQLGQGGVVLLGSAETQPVNNLIAANNIEDCGLIYKHVAGVYLTTGSSNRIAHNRMRRLPRYGVSLKTYNKNDYSHDNIIEFNDITDTNQETNDTGTIELLGRDRQNSGNIIRYNFLRNSIGMGTDSYGKMLSPFMASGIFLDDHSSGVTIYGNVIAGSSTGAIMCSNGKDNKIENNIFFVDKAKYSINLLQLDELMQGNIFKRNIIVLDNANGAFWKSHSRNWNRQTLAEVDFNLYWHRGGLDLVKMVSSLTPEGSFTQWQEAGFDRHSLIADPKFANPEKGDFRMAPDSPAFQLGFKPIPLARIGLEGFRKEA
ncbi:MAG: right-handed parallel beta-helix repeat-containing protein [Actinomycetota bacterium]